MDFEARKVPAPTLGPNPSGHTSDPVALDVSVKSTSGARPATAASWNMPNKQTMNAQINCLVCGHPEPRLFLDLGSTALANRFLLREELSAAESTFPLRVGFCPVCTHVQLLDRVPPHAMFDDYLYVSSASETLKRHFDELSRTLTRRLDLPKGALIVDIGCNDGTLLEAFRRNSVDPEVVGVDPAHNLALATAHLGIPRYEMLFAAESAALIHKERGGAHLITCTNTFPHIQDPASFIEGLKLLLMPGGTFVAEMHYLGDLLDQMAFDTVYHEHVSYWSLGPLQRLFRNHDLEVTDVERLPIHHGQLRIFVQRKGEGPIQASVPRLLEEEEKRGLRDFETYRRFAVNVARIKHNLNRTLADIATQGHSVVGYGAPAKGNTLLSYLHLGTDKIDYIVDRSSLKQGRYTPGMHVPVLAPERLLADQPDYVLLLAWNFAEEIMEQQAEYRARGGHFILPLPEVRIT